MKSWNDLGVNKTEVVSRNEKVKKELIVVARIVAELVEKEKKKEERRRRERELKSGERG